EHSITVNLASKKRLTLLPYSSGETVTVCTVVARARFELVDASSRAAAPDLIRGGWGPRRAEDADAAPFCVACRSCRSGRGRWRGPGVCRPPPGWRGPRLVFMARISRTRHGGGQARGRASVTVNA